MNRQPKVSYLYHLQVNERGGRKLIYGLDSMEFCRPCVMAPLGSHRPEFRAAKEGR